MAHSSSLVKAPHQMLSSHHPHRRRQHQSQHNGSQISITFYHKFLSYSFPLRKRYTRRSNSHSFLAGADQTTTRHIDSRPSVELLSLLLSTPNQPTNQPQEALCRLFTDVGIIIIISMVVRDFFFFQSFEAVQPGVPKLIDNLQQQLRLEPFGATEW